MVKYKLEKNNKYVCNIKMDEQGLIGLACLKFAFKTKIIDKFVIGISKYDQLIEIIKILKKRTLINSLPKELKNVSPKLLNPKLWN